MRKKLIACLAALSIMVTATACSGGNNQTDTSETVSTEVTLSADYRFTADSVYYGMNEKEATSFGVQDSKFSYINEDTNDVIQGTVTESGDLESDGRSVSYAVKDGKITLTIGDAEYIYDAVTEDKYTAYTQLLRQHVDTTEFTGDDSGGPAIPTEPDTSEPGDSSESEPEVTTEPPTNIPEAELTQEELNDMAADSVEMIDSDRNKFTLSVEYMSETDSYAILFEVISDEDLGLADVMYQAYPADGLTIATDEGYMYKVDMTGMISKENAVTVWWSYPTGGGVGKIKIQQGEDAPIECDNMIIMSQN